MFFSTQTQRLQKWLVPPINKVRSWLTPIRKRRIWQGLTIVSLLLVGLGLAYTWRELPEAQRQLNVTYLALAVGIYLLTYVMHLLGWHAIAGVSLGRFPILVDVEAVAASDLVKYLPTVAWYIANRVYYYGKRQVPQRAVVAASLLEMVIMLGTGGILLLLLWLSRSKTWLSVVLALILIVVVFKVWGSRFRGWWINRIASQQSVHDAGIISWIAALFWYGISWLGGAIFLAAIIQVFAPVDSDQYLTLINIWLIAGLAGYIVSLSVGTIGIAREATLTFLLAQYWPLHIAIATAVMVKLILTVGQVGSALLIIGTLNLARKVKP